MTFVQQVKGLEFDYAVIPDADASAYLDTPENRRLIGKYVEKFVVARRRD